MGPEVTKTDIRRVLYLPDVHVPLHDRQAIEAVLSYMWDEWFDEVVQLGDFLDLNAPSAHNEGKPKVVEGERLQEDYRIGRSVLDDLLSAARNRNKACKFTMLKGNHEYRVDRWVDRYPLVEGLVEPEIGLQLKLRQVKWVESYPKGELYKIGHLYATHGTYCNEHHAKKHVERYGVNVVYGHTHQVQQYSKVLHGKNKTLQGVSLGCLCRMDMPYLGGAPTSWQHAIGVAHFLPNGFYSLAPVLIFNGEFVAPNGRKYSYRDKMKGKKRG